MGATGVKPWLALSLALGLAACADDARRRPATAPAPAATYGPAPVVAQPPGAPEPRPASDQCGLDELRGLVGKSRMEIPVPLEPGRRRVLCETCPRSQDVVAGRQTVLFDARTGLVTSVACG